MGKYLAQKVLQCPIRPSELIDDMSSVEDECEVERDDQDDEDISSIEDECDVEYMEVVMPQVSR